MFLSDLRAQQAAHDLPTNAAGADHASDPSCGPDAQLIADCRSFVNQHGVLLEGIAQAAEIETIEHASLMASLCETSKKVAALVQRISSEPALTAYGVQNKQAVADLLLSTQNDEPSPSRDCLLLSLLHDAERLSYPAAVGARVLSGEQVTDAATTVAVGKACLTLADQVKAAFLRLEQGNLLGCTEQEQLASELLALLQQWQVAITRLVGTAAVGVSAVRMKARVLQSLLQVQDSDFCEIRADLSRSYLSDLSGLLTAIDRSGASPSQVGSFWNTLSAGFRRLAACVYPG